MSKNVTIEMIGDVEKEGITLTDAVELMDVVKRYNNQEFPRLTEEEFSMCLFGYIKLRGMYEFMLLA